MVLATNFIEGLEDVPLMQGLQQIQKDNLSFGNEETKFVEVYLESKNITFKKIVDFYKQTLPQLGWKYKENHKDNYIFERENELFSLSLEEKAPLLVRISVKSNLE